MTDAARLFAEHHQALYRYLVRFGGDPDAAADAAQEAFVRLVERPPPDGARGAWLYRVATNVLLDASRGGARRRRLLDGADARVPFADPARDPHDLLEARERASAVSAALATLAPKERTALLMREEGFTHREIADALETTTGSVGTLLARALDRLAARIDLDSHLP